jgi:hypothetical protein
MVNKTSNNYITFVKTVLVTQGFLGGSMLASPDVEDPVTVGSETKGPIVYWAPPLVHVGTFFLPVTRDLLIFVSPSAWNCTNPKPDRYELSPRLRSVLRANIVRIFAASPGTPKLISTEVDIRKTSGFFLCWCTPDICITNRIWDQYSKTNMTHFSSQFIKYQDLYTWNFNTGAAKLHNTHTVYQMSLV